MTDTHHAIIKADQRGRLRFTPDQRATLLAAYDTSGLSGPKFAQLHGLNYQTFAGWLQRRKRGPAPKPSRSAPGAITFIEADTAAALGGSAALEVHLAGGAKLLIDNRAQISLAAALIRELTNPRPC
jgi:transposase-like protein